MLSRLLLCLLLSFVATATLADDTNVPPPQDPQVAEASREAQDAISSFQLPSGWQAQLFAAEPHVANIVAFTIDTQGRVYICESFRQNEGVTDNRGHDDTWLRADLAAQTVADRIAFHRELLGPEGVAKYQAQDDRIRLVVDTDGDGTADRSTVFASGFNHLEDGTGAGVLAYDDSVYYTCIPKLWKLTDRDGDGQADERVVLHDGYGVRVAFRGHDMHGLILGPDGRLYFSIGDRGYHVTTSEGRLLHDPSSGAVFRCELDGSNLEVFATGLRNPQELAFDQYGNLFTGDNNSDGGDKARWVYVVEGGDTGWRMEYQYLPDRGPFNREKIWHPFHSDQPAYLMPPVENVADGPSGLLYYPGTGLGEQFHNTFLLADFRGTPIQSGIRTLQVEPNGAFFKLTSNEKLVWKILATDLAMGPDGNLYISDWVDGWDGTGKGRIYRFQPGEDAKLQAEREQVAAILLGDWSQPTVEQLSQWLAHADQRVRQQSQFQLVKRSAAKALVQVATDPHAILLARVHAIWGLGQMARQKTEQKMFLDAVQPLLMDNELEVRAAACLVLGDNRYVAAGETLVQLMADPQPRVAHYAANAVAKLQVATAVPAAVSLLERGNNQDPVLRLGGVLVLAACAANDQQISQLSSHASMAVRLGAVVALRRRHSRELEKFLGDQELQVVAEAVRAIHDLPVVDSLPAVAKLLTRDDLDNETRFRAMNANYRLGGAQAAQLIASAANNDSLPERLRVEAVKMLATWAKPDPRDRYLNAWRPIAERSDDVAMTAFAKVVDQLFDESSELQQVVIDTAVQFNLPQAIGPLEELLSSDAQPNVRANALRSVAKLDRKRAQELVEPLLNSDQWQISSAALDVLADLDPKRAGDALARAVKSSDVGARQAAWRLAKKLSKTTDTTAVLTQGINGYLDGSLSPEEWLDLLEAAEGALPAPLQSKLDSHQQKWIAADPVNKWRWALAGGDAERGKNIFLYKTEVSCLRCHKVGNQGGEVGPVLSDIGAKKDARYLLEAIALPNAKIAEGFESVMIVDDIGQLHSGVLKKETDEYVEYMTAEGKLERIDKEAIEDRRDGTSAMPADLINQLNSGQLRDLVAYLASLKGQDKDSGH